MRIVIVSLLIAVVVAVGGTCYLLRAGYWSKEEALVYAIYVCVMTTLFLLGVSALINKA